MTEARLQDRFDAAMMATYIEAKKADYNATYLLQMLNDLGGLATAKKLINDSTPSDGFTKLWEMRRLDLTVERLAIRSQYRDLFTQAEVIAARRRLEQYGWELSSD